MQRLIIQYAKKQSFFRGMRNELSETPMPVHTFFVRHHLSHYALALTWGITEGFMALGNNRCGLPNFADRRKQPQLARRVMAWNAVSRANLFLDKLAQWKRPVSICLGKGQLVKRVTPWPNIDSSSLNSDHEFSDSDSTS